MKTPFPLFIISGPSGVGKTVIIRRARKRLPLLRIGTTYTTRRERKGKQEDKIMRFVNKRQFEQLIRDGAFMEWAHVHGEYYGTARTPLLASLRQGPTLLNIDVQGALQIKQQMPDAVLIFIRPRSLTELKSRILRRGPIAPQELSQRLKDAQQEMNMMRRYTHRIVNQEQHREEAVKKLVFVIQKHLRKNIH